MRAKVYDIINAGPRHRFTANGVVVSNCGRIVQPQNFPRPTLEEADIIPGIDAVKNGVQDLLGYDTMELCSSALRYAICAPEGKKLVVADLANIEGRFLAWLAGEKWKLEAFKKYDTFILDENGNRVFDSKGKPKREGPDLYVAAFAKAFRMSIDAIGDKERSIGKVMELAFGFQGGVGAFLAFANKIDLNTLPDTVLPYANPEIISEAEKFYEWLDGMDRKEAENKAEKSDDSFCSWEDFYEPKKTFGMSKDVFVAIDCLKRQWRKEHPAICKFWKDAEQAMRYAVEVPNVPFPFGKCKAVRKGKWVLIVLPSGRVIPYPGMRIGKTKKKGDFDENGDIVEEDDSTQSGKLVFRGINQFSKQWGDIMTGAGKIAENCTQAGARDVFKHGEVLASKENYDIVLKVHDELVTEVPDAPTYSVKRLCELMSVVPDWAEGLPLAAEGKESYRYHK
jgi:DNA polymerase